MTTKTSVVVGTATCTMLTSEPMPCFLCGVMTQPMVPHSCTRDERRPISKPFFVKVARATLDQHLRRWPKVFKGLIDQECAKLADEVWHGAPKRKAKKGKR